MDMNERLRHFPAPWKPEPGDQLIGKIVALDERETEYGTYPMVTVETEAGDEVCWHAFHTVAKNELAKLRPVAGDRLGVAYQGKDPVKNYERYRVIVERARPTEATGPNWDAMAKEAAAESETYGLI